MSNTNKTGGPAFPEVRIRSGDNYNPPTKLYYGGMTLRDYFAAKAMQAILSPKSNVSDQFIADCCARSAYEIADAMLKARNT